MKKIFKLIEIALIAVIGFSMTACDDGTSGGGGGGGGGTSADPLNGAWKADDDETITLTNGRFVMAQNGKEYAQGKYTSGARSVSNITMNVEELHGDTLTDILNEAGMDITLGNKWYAKNQLIDALKKWMKDAGGSDVEIAGILNDLSGDFDKIYPTMTGTIDGNKMTVDGTTYTKAGGTTPGSTTPGGTTPGGSSSGTTFTLIDIPSIYEGKYARFTGSGGDVTLTGYQNMTSNDIILPRIVNGKVTIPMWEMRGTISNPSFVRYTGNGSFMMGTVNFYNSESDNVNRNGHEILNIVFYSVTFSNGNATKSWNDSLTGPIFPQN